MRKLLLGTALVAASGLTSLTASAQDVFRTADDPGAIRASDFIGHRVYATETAITAGGIAGVQDAWEDIGEVNDILLTRDGQVGAVLVDIGGFLGMGERQVAIRPGSLYFVDDTATGNDPNDFLLVMTAGRSVLEGAPIYDSARRGAEGQDGAGATAMSGNTADGDAQRATDIQTLQNSEGSAEGGISDRETAERQDTDGRTDTVAGSGMRVDGYTTVDKTALTTADLEGLRVLGTNDENLGEISNFVLGDTGTITNVIVDVGGFLGIGQKPVAIDIASLEILRADGGKDIRAYLPMTRDQLEALPTVE